MTSPYDFLTVVFWYLQKLCPQISNPYLLWLYVSLEFPLGLFTGFRVYSNLLCQCQRHENLGASPEVLIFNENWKVVWNSKWKNFRSVSVAINAEGYVNRAVMGWSLSHALHEVPAVFQCSQVLTTSMSLMRMRRLLAPCRTAQPLFKKTWSKRQVFLHPRWDACHMPCHAESHAESTGNSEPFAMQLEVPQQRRQWCSHRTAKLGLQEFLQKHTNNSTTYRRQLFVSQIIKISHILPEGYIMPPKPSKQ